MDEIKLVKWPVQRSQVKRSFYNAWPQWKKKNTQISSDIEELYNLHVYTSIKILTKGAINLTDNHVHAIR